MKLNICITIYLINQIYFKCKNNLFSLSTHVCFCILIWSCTLQRNLHAAEVTINSCRGEITVSYPPPQKKMSVVRKYFHVVGFLIALDSTIENRSPDFTSTSADYLSEDNSTTLVLTSEFTPIYHMVSSSILPLLKSSTSFDEATTSSTGSITLCR